MCYQFPLPVRFSIVRNKVCLDLRLRKTYKLSYTSRLGARFVKLPAQNYQFYSFNRKVIKRLKWTLNTLRILSLLFVSYILLKLSNEEAHYSQSRKYSIQKIAWDFVDHYYTLGTAFNEPVTFLSAIHFLCIEQALQVYSSK